jgi:heat shock protein HslJ
MYRLVAGLAIFAFALAVCTGCAAATEGEASGVWGSAGGGTPRLELDPSGMIKGNDGCNGIGGRWRQTEPGVLEFTETVMGLMACPGVEGQWLGRMSSATVDGDTLVIRDGDGTMLGTLRRS